MKMKQWNTLSAAVALALLLGTTAARAEITAEQVWQGWVDYYATTGQTVTAGAKEMQGDTLVVTDAVFASPADAEGSFTSTVSEIRLKETGDGRVEITLSNEIPIVVKGKSAEGGSFDTNIKVTQEGLVVTASGSPEDITYDTVAPLVGVSVDGMNVDGEAAPLTVNLEVRNSTGTSHMVRTGGFAIDSSMKAESVALTMKGADPKTPGSSFDLTGSFSDIAGTSKGSIVEGADLSTNLAAALNAGTNFSGEFSYGAGTYAANFAGAEGAGKMDYKGDGGKVHFVMSKDGLGYGGESGAAQMSMTIPNMPMPLDLSIGSSAFDLAMPVSKSDSPQPFKLLTRLTELKLSDGIWDLFDAGKQLPRDPATLVIDAAGHATMKIDIFDPANANSQEMPGQVDDVTLIELRLTAAGAELTGSGAATFDNSVMPPKPVGSVDLKLVGGNGLLDKIVAMGLIPEEQATGFRMMLGIFALPAGDDVLTSKIEFAADGSISANGQRLK
jgi:hypothetical protein